MNKRVKVGAIALKEGEEFVEIKEVIIEKIPIYKDVKTGFFSHKKIDTGEFEEKITEIWWKRVGDTSNLIKGGSNAIYMNWDGMIVKANLLLSQAKILFKNEKN